MNLQTGLLNWSEARKAHHDGSLTVSHHLKWLVWCKALMMSWSTSCMIAMHRSLKHTTIRTHAALLR